MKIPVHNPSPMPMYVHGVMIPGGETRHFDEADVPPHLRPAPAVEETPQDEAPNPLAELAKKPVSEIVEALHGLSDADLATLGELEQTRTDRKPRTTLLAAIGEEQLLRSDIAAELQGDEEAVRKALLGVGTPVLPRMRLMEAAGKNRPGVLEAIDAEIAAREQA